MSNGRRWRRILELPDELAHLEARELATAEAAQLAIAAGIVRCPWCGELVDVEDHQAATVSVTLGESGQVLTGHLACMPH
jgi:hypothetical protein